MNIKLKNTINNRLLALRKSMKEHHIDALLVPTADAHQSEYVPSFAKDREWISGFTGSAGMAIVTQLEAAVWTDARYYLQAEEELKGTGFVLQKHEKRFDPQHLEWLLSLLSEGNTIGINPWNFTVAQEKQLQDFFKGSGIKLTHIDLIGALWKDRPAMTQNAIFDFPKQFAGLSREDKFKKVRDILHYKKADAYLVTALDEIAWLTNLRGSDVDFNPVFMAYLVLDHSNCYLFANTSKLEISLVEDLATTGIILRPYDDILVFLEKNELQYQTILLDEHLVNINVAQPIKGASIHVDSIIHDLKGVKNMEELTSWSEAMVYDGVALVHAFYWLENELDQRSVTEYEFALKIASYRALQEGYLGESFAAIVGYKSNGAIIHYHPSEQNSKDITSNGILLCDSGGQYLKGTTDITRTIALGTPDKGIRTHFTAVLKGMIHLTKAVFPDGTTGGQLDLLARQYLWQMGLDFKHGTGHGVGHCLNVHEGPQGFAPINTSRGKKPLEVGMVLTNEPGYYEDGQYGIRIENMMKVIPAKYDGFLTFQTMTWFPIDQAMIDETIMSASEKAWFNQYHTKVYELLSPHIQDQEMKSWLKRKCKPLN